MKISLTKVTFLLSAFILLIVYLVIDRSNKPSTSGLKSFWSSKKARVKAGELAYQKPDGFMEYYANISKNIGASTNSYQKGYRGKALKQAYYKAQKRASSSFNAEFISRGPGNVGGRTRAIAIDPDDPTHSTWIAGAASGGIWKTTDCGQNWTNISEGLPNLSTNSIAQAISNPDIIYVGTGEVFAGNSTFVRGDGVYKSTDRGATWSLLNSTVDNVKYLSVNRIAIDPLNENVVVIATNSGIYKSVDGGASWTETFNTSASGAVQDLQVDPSDFNIQYAGVNSKGILKSTDGGNTWFNSSNGIGEGVRFEIAIAPSNTSIVYTSSYVGNTSLLYYSADKGDNWIRVSDKDFDTNFLGAQGWYDNTIEVNPYNPYEVFVGGVNIGKFLLDPDNINATEPAFLGLDEINTNFLNFVNFGASFNDGSIDIADGNLSPSENPVTVEIRWGGNNSQKAHRFVVPANSGPNGDGGAQVPITDYNYQDYVDVPFEVWDIENDRQLMVSFRDQQNDGTFNLNSRDDIGDPELLKAREYFYIHDLTYSATTPQSEVVNTVGGIQFANMYYFWPILAQGTTWSPSSFSNAILRINYGYEVVANAKASAVYDAYGNYNKENQNSLHPDHHNLTFVKTDEANQEFMVVNGNDGSFGFSSNNGVDFVERENGYVTSQFYGADKKPGEDKYIGGTQDNGTWVSTGSTVDANSPYNFVIGGDGFEVLWHAENTDLVMGTIYNNRIFVSKNGGNSFNSSSSGITNQDGPFITRLSSATTSPDIVYAIGAAGVYKSTNFGQSWSIKTINDNTWGANNSSNDVEVSLANDSIVWAGAGMANGILNIFVSKDRAESFNKVNLPSIDPRAYTTGIYTHPEDENTAFVLFSVANQAKILKTEDLGETWSDISGFGNANESANGFPDVFTHCLLVMPFNTDIIWAGTEIGIFESLDAGESWSLRTDMPSVSIWSMKVVDDQVVIGTHGRGIWTATIAELNSSSASIISFEYEGYGEAKIGLNLPVQYDKVSILIDDEFYDIVASPSIGENVISISDFYQFDGAKFTLVTEIGVNEYVNEFTIKALDRSPEVLNFSTSFDLENSTYPIQIELENNDPFSKVEVLINGLVEYTDVQELSADEEKRVISFVYTKKGSNTVLIKSYINEFVFETIINGLVTSAKPELNTNFNVYPVPAHNFLEIKSIDNRIREYQIYSSNGKLIESKTVKEKTQIKLDISHLKEGIYLLQAKDIKGRILTNRFIKK